MARRPKGWLIRQAGDGKCDVFFDRRSVVYDRDDVDEAARVILRDPRWAGQEVTVEEPNGYQRPLETKPR